MKETTCPGLPGTVPTYTCYPSFSLGLTFHHLSCLKVWILIYMIT